jgi:hypothetical protein
MEVDLNIISTWAAIIAALSAVIALWVEGKRSRYSQGIDLLFRLFDTFDSEIMKSKRRKVSRLLLKKLNGKLSKSDYSTLLTTIGDILDHFQWVAILFQKRRLDYDLVYSGYSWWVVYYCILLKIFCRI